MELKWLTWKSGFGVVKAWYARISVDSLEAARDIAEKSRLKGGMDPSQVAKRARREYPPRHGGASNQLACQRPARHGSYKAQSLQPARYCRSVVPHGRQVRLLLDIPIFSISPAARLSFRLLAARVYCSAERSVVHPNHAIS